MHVAQKLEEPQQLLAAHHQDPKPTLVDGIRNLGYKVLHGLRQSARLGGGQQANHPLPAAGAPRGLRRSARLAGGQPANHPLPAARAPRKIVAFSKEVTRMRDCYLMEYIKRGDLTGFQNRFANAAGKDGQIPNRMLWLIFGCLIKGLIAMRYPVRYQPGYPGRHKVHGVPLRSETIPTENGDDNKMVHFDLDSQNCE